MTHTLNGESWSANFVYGARGELVSHTWSGGLFDGLAVSNRFDHLLRRTNVAVLNGAAQLSASGYAYDPASRLLKVTSGVNSATYSYLANAPLVSQIAFTNNGSWRMTTSKQFDQLNRLQSMASVAPTFTAASFEYTYNNANQRTERREADGVYWRYEYDPLGQVTSGKKYWADGIPVAGQQFEYAFDDIGNRTSTKAGGDQDGANLRSASYSPNLLNQYASRTVPGAVDVMGVALATNTVTVDGQAPYRKGEYFRKELTVVNTSVPVWKSLTVSAPGETPVTRSEFVPKTPELFTHDLDGNLVADGRWNYTWDGENRLVAMAARTGVGPQISLKFEYDAQGRRIRKQVWGNAAWSGSATNDLRFVYDGWNLIAVLSPQSTVLRSFTWGLDLSGSLQGAGGVGGLLMVNDTANGVHFPAFDGNGNVAALVKSDGTLSAQYEYGPFAEVLRVTGPMAKINPFRFSTKYQDEETDLVYYGYRYYNANTGRWLSSDPIGEEGGENLYCFVSEDPVNQRDPLGLAELEYWSQGKVYFDGGGSAYIGSVSLGQYDRTYSESGIRNSPSASFSQSVVINYGCSGGICNSTISDSASSEVRARVKNVSRCYLVIECSCHLEWFVRNSTPSKQGKRVTRVKATVLDKKVNRVYAARRQPDGSYLSVGRESLDGTKQFLLAPGASTELYHGFPIITSAGLRDAGFGESMSGNCSCKVLN